MIRKIKPTSLLLLCAFMVSCGIARANTVADLCPNRSAFVMLDRKFMEDVKMRFIAISSLPYEVEELPTSQDFAILQISYRRLLPGDSFSEPLSIELGDRVYRILEADFQKFKIKKIWAEYDLGISC